MLPVKGAQIKQKVNILTFFSDGKCSPADRNHGVGAWIMASCSYFQLAMMDPAMFRKSSKSKSNNLMHQIAFHDANRLANTVIPLLLAAFSINQKS
jgi:hypothetical protein